MKGTSARTSSYARWEPTTEGSRAAQVDRLGGDRELDRDDPRPELDHLREPPRGEWRHRRPVLDSVVLRRAHELVRDRLGEKTGLRSERLDRGSELAEAGLGERWAGGKALRQPAVGRLEELQRAL